MSKTEVGYLLGAAFVFWWFGTRSDRLGRQLEHVSSRIRRDMAELLGKTDHANKLRQEWEQVEKEHKKAVRREVLSFWGIVGAAAVAGWWFW